MASARKNDDRNVALNSTGDASAEKLSEPPVIANDVPLPPMSVTQDRRERPFAVQSSNGRTSSKGSKGGGKSSGGKGGSGKTLSRSAHSSASVGYKPKRKKAKKVFKIKGCFLGGLKYGTGKKTSPKSGAGKSVARKRYRGK